jgi:hypothetical protein
MELRSLLSSSLSERQIVCVFSVQEVKIVASCSQLTIANSVLHSDWQRD